MKYHIYKITSPSGKIYIGLTKNIEQRFKTYEKLRCKNQTFLYNSLLKYGWENHIKEIILTLDSLKEAEIKEIEHILLYKQLNCSLNIRNGGIGGNLIGAENSRSKKVFQYDKEGKLIKKWNCISDIERELKISTSLISIVCVKQTYYAKNYYWCFEKDIKNITFSRKIGKSGNIILKLDFSLNIVEEFASAVDAAKGNKTDYCGIIDCLYLKYKSYLGYFWIKKKNFSIEFIKKLQKIPERTKAKRAIKIYRIVNGEKQIFNSINEAFEITKITTYTISRHLKSNNKIKKQEWFYEK